MEIKIDEKNKHLLNEKWFLDKDGYAINRKGRMHRIIMNAPKDMVVDHINHDKLDNREENLRIVTRQENARNRKKTTGVFKRNDTDRWQAQIMHNYKNICLGCYGSYEEALIARKDAETRMWSHG